MKALIYKDLCALRLSTRTLVMMMVIYIAIGVIISNIGMTLGVLTVICSVMMLSLFSYDEFSRWDSYVYTLPIPRADIATARYLVGLMMLGVGVVLSLVLWGILALLGTSSGTPAQVMGALGGTTGAALAIMAVTFPVCYRYGTEKARLSMVVVFLLPIAAMVAANRLGIPMPSEKTVIRMLQAAAVIIPLGYFISWRYSCAICEQKEA